MNVKPLKVYGDFEIVLNMYTILYTAIPITFKGTNMRYGSLLMNFILSTLFLYLDEKTRMLT